MTTFEGTPGGAAAPRLLPLTPRSTLAGPGPGGPADEASDAPQAVTGGGLLAILDPRSGVLSLWRGRAALAGRLEIEVAGARASPEGPFHSRSGSWTGRYRLPGGGALVETGLLADSVRAAVFQWSLPPGVSAPAPASHPDQPGRLVARLFGPGGSVVEEARLSISVDAPAILAVLSPDEDRERAASLLTPLSARERQRRGRAGVHIIEPFALSVDGRPAEGVEAALRALDDAALDEPAGPKPPLFVGAISRDGPSYLEGTALAELGTAALLAGRRPIARAALKALAADPGASPPAFIRLAARYVLWTGLPDVLSSLTAELEEAVEAVRAAPPEAGYPGPDETLDLLRSALEPFGRIGTRLVGGEDHPEAPAAAHVHLPMAGGGRSAPGSEADRRAEARLRSAGPSVDSSRPGHPLPPILDAAELLRSWVEGELGVEPDASYGRVHLGPRIAGGREALEVRGLAVADAALRLDVRRAPGSYEICVSQEGGRIPLNLIFAPWLPLRRVSEVRMEGEVVRAELVPVGEGTRVQMQFPLDPSRAIAVTGTS